MWRRASRSWGVSTSPGSHRCAASNVLTVAWPSSSRAPTSPRSCATCGRIARPSATGWPAHAVVGGAHGRGAGRRGLGVVHDGGDDLRRDARLVAEGDEHPVAVADRLHAAAQRGRHALRPSPRTRPPARVAEVDGLAHALGLGAEDDDDRIDRRHGEHRVDRVLQERRRRRARRAAWASRSATRRPRRARRRRSSGDLVDAPAAQVRQPAALAAAAVGHDLAHDRQRGLLGRERAEVEADRRAQARELLVGDALGPASRSRRFSCARREPMAPT